MDVEQQGKRVSPRVTMKIACCSRAVKTVGQHSPARYETKSLSSTYLRPESRSRSQYARGSDINFLPGSEAYISMSSAGISAW